MAIPRRTFLKSAAASSLVPTATWHHLIAQAASTPVTQTPDLHIVGAGEDRYGEQRGRRFSRMTFKVGTQDTAGNLFVIEHVDMRPGGGPALHLHFSQEEYFYVLEGEIAFLIGDKRIQLKAGESVVGPRRVQHCFAAVAPASRLLISYAPAGKMEKYFSDTLTNPALLDDAQYNNQCELQLVGPNPLLKPAPGA